jgi:hypothetical protein
MVMIGIGVGKIILLMLPAFSMSDGTTIVVKLRKSIL